MREFFDFNYANLILRTEEQWDEQIEQMLRHVVVLRSPSLLWTL